MGLILNLVNLPNDLNCKVSRKTMEAGEDWHKPRKDERSLMMVGPASPGTQIVCDKAGFLFQQNASTPGETNLFSNFFSSSASSWEKSV
jgi:hypothetical protein